MEPDMVEASIEEVTIVGNLDNKKHHHTNES